MKTRTSRRRINLDANTIAVLEHWRHRLAAEGATIESSTPMFLNAHHRHAHPGFTMHTYQHLLAGMGAVAATRFADLVDAAR